MIENGTAEFRTGVIRPVECFKEAWEMIRDQYWMVFAVVIVGMLVASLVPLLLLGPMMCGIYLCLFEKFEGRPMSFDKLFKGFDLFLPSLLLALIIVVPVLLMIFLIYVPMVAMALSGAQMSESELLYFVGGALAVELVFAVIMVCLHTLLLFSFPLLVDKRISAWRSVTLSARAVWANMSGVAGLFAVGFAVAIVGYLMLCIGVYLVIPLIIAANVVAYRKIFPSEPRPFSSPPTPDLYPGLQ